jgi:hypothetical protein
MAKVPSKKKRAPVRPERIDRRFLPEASVSSTVLYALLVAGALLLGAGVWGQFGLTKPFEHAFWLLLAGCVLLAISLWFSTSGDAAVRVGASGIALERGGLRRIPWYGLRQISWDESAEALVVAGADEQGLEFSFNVRARTHAAACAHMLAEAAERMPTKLDVPEAVRERCGAPNEFAGTKLMEPLQIVGRHCAKTGKVLTYEPDARNCSRCERVYHKRSTPRTCACGHDLTDQRDAVGVDDDELEGEPLPS